MTAPPRPKAPPRLKAPSRLKLRAEDAADLAVLSACLQGAVFAVGEMAFDAAAGRFAAVVVRRRPDSEPGALGQTKAAVHFDAVSAVKLRGIDRARPGRLLRLVGMFAEPGRKATVVRLLFLDGAELWLEAGRLACRLQDLEDAPARDLCEGAPAR